MKGLIEKNSHKNFKNKNLFDTLSQVKINKFFQSLGKKEKTKSISYGPDVKKGHIVKYSLLGKSKLFEKSHLKEQKRESEDKGLRIKYGLTKDYKKKIKKIQTPLAKRYRAKPRVPI